MEKHMAGGVERLQALAVQNIGIYSRARRNTPLCDDEVQEYFALPTIALILTPSPKVGRRGIEGPGFERPCVSHIGYNQRNPHVTSRAVDASGSIHCCRRRHLPSLPIFGIDSGIAALKNPSRVFTVSLPQSAMAGIGHSKALG